MQGTRRSVFVRTRFGAKGRSFRVARLTGQSLPIFLERRGNAPQKRSCLVDWQGGQGVGEERCPARCDETSPGRVVQPGVLGPSPTDLHVQDLTASVGAPGAGAGNGLADTRAADQAKRLRDSAWSCLANYARGAS